MRLVAYLSSRQTDCFCTSTRTQTVAQIRSSDSPAFVSFVNVVVADRFVSLRLHRQLPGICSSFLTALGCLLENVNRELTSTIDGCHGEMRRIRLQNRSFCLF